MPRITLATVIKLLIASFLVGMGLALFDLTPRELVGWLRELAGGIVADFWGWAEWALSYVLLGAVIVIPVWLLGFLWKAVRRRG